jgi:hypothetical protein
MDALPHGSRIVVMMMLRLCVACPGAGQPLWTSSQRGEVPDERRGGYDHDEDA